MPFFKKSLAGPGYIILNVIRVMNIIALLSVIAASFVMLVKTFVVSKFFFFDGVSHVITGCVSILLILTELSLFRRYTANNWPLLSPSHGFVTLGIIMIIIGVSILGNLNKQATSEESIGTTFWRLVIGSGIVVIILGAINIFASYMFRRKALDITARQVRAHGAVAEQKVYVSPSSTRSIGKRSFHLSRSDTLPTHFTPLHHQQPTRNISAPVTKSPQYQMFDATNEVQPPDLAHHPAMQGRGQGQPF